MAFDRFAPCFVWICLGIFPSSALANPENLGQSQFALTYEKSSAELTVLADLNWTVAASPVILSEQFAVRETPPNQEDTTLKESELQPQLVGSEVTGSEATLDRRTIKTVPETIGEQTLQSAELLRGPGVENSEPEKFKTSPLQTPVRLFNLETANQLPAGALSASGGVRFFFRDQVGLGTGLQVYNLSIDGGVTDRLQLGFSAILFDDTLGRQVSGGPVALQFLAVAPQLKYQLVQSERLSLGFSGSVELLRIFTTPGLLNPTPETVVGNSLAGTLQAPVSYSLNSDLQLHFTPGVGFYPETLNGAPFFGTIFNLGAGLSWQALERLSLFTDVNLPLTGGNTVRSQDSSISRRAVWSAGLRYFVNPSVGLDLYATNAFGTTPATRLLSFVPDGDQTAIGFNVNYTPDLGQGYAPSFRETPLVQLNERDVQLLLDGVTLTSADTLLPGMLRVRGGLGAGDGFNLAYGVTNDFQLEFFGEQFRTGEDLDSDTYGPGVKVGPAVKFRLLDQVQGDPFSLALKAAFAADLSSSIGLFSAEIPFLYRPIPQVALFFSPKAGLVLEEELLGTGLGINYALTDQLQLVGEFTPLFTGQDPVWSVAARYFNLDLKLGVDVYASNAVGQNILGGLIAQSDGDSSVGFNIHWLVGGPRF